MAKAKAILQVPITITKYSDWDDAIGSLLHYVQQYEIDKERAQMVEAVNFTEPLTCKDMRSGRSAKYVIWKTADGRAFPMFITDLVAALPYIDHGVLNTEMTFCKRGQNYGIRVFGSQKQDK